MNKPNSAHLIDTGIRHARRSVKALALECGFSRQNMLSMIRTGQTPLPITRIPLVAKVLHLDASELMTERLREAGYWTAISEAYGLDRS